MKIFLAFAAAFAFFFYVIIYIGWAPNYSDGERTGEMYKFARKGLIWKSWEGSMYLGGVHSSGGKNPTLQLDTFEFSIASRNEDERKEIIEKITKCARERAVCTIQYRQWLKSPIYINSSYEVIGVEMRDSSDN